jgi:hypothetical protein
MPANCHDCGSAFSVQPEEVEWLTANSKDVPTVCPRCRAFAAGIQDESITCTVCGKVFIYPRELRLFARMFSWPRPRRCIGGCRAPGPEPSDVEKQVTDFLRRMRAAAKLNAPVRSSLASGTSGGLSLRSSSGGGSSRLQAPVEGASALAQALKEFQEKKRRKH